MRRKERSGVVTVVVVAWHASYHIGSRPNELRLRRPIQHSINKSVNLKLLQLHRPSSSTLESGATHSSFCDRTSTVELLFSCPGTHRAAVLCITPYNGSLLDRGTTTEDPQMLVTFKVHQRLQVLIKECTPFSLSRRSDERIKCKIL